MILKLCEPPKLDGSLNKVVEPVRIELTSEKDPSPPSTGIVTVLILDVSRPVTGYPYPT